MVIWTRGHMPVIPTLGSQRREVCKFKASLVYVVRCLKHCNNTVMVGVSSNEENWVIICVSQLSVNTVANTWDNQFKKRKGLFSLTVVEISVNGRSILSPWGPCLEAERKGFQRHATVAFLPLDPTSQKFHHIPMVPQAGNQPLTLGLWRILI
jgi:hypothetical protein